MSRGAFVLFSRHRILFVFRVNTTTDTYAIQPLSLLLPLPPHSRQSMIRRESGRRLSEVAWILEPNHGASCRPGRWRCTINLTTPASSVDHLPSHSMEFTAKCRRSAFFNVSKKSVASLSVKSLATLNALILHTRKATRRNLNSEAAF